MPKTDIPRRGGCGAVTDTPSGVRRETDCPPRQPALCDRAPASGLAA